MLDASTTKRYNRTVRYRVATQGGLEVADAPDVIFETQSDCDIDVSAPDVDHARRVFGVLSDRCQRALLSDRLDLDDVLLEHRIVFELAHRRVESALHAVGDPNAWRRAARQAAAATPGTVTAPLRCVALKIAVLRERDDPVRGFTTPRS